MEGGGMAVDCRPYTSAICAHAGGPWEGALALWARMRRRRIAPDERCGLAALRAMRTARPTARWEEATALLASIEADACVPPSADLVGEVVEACVRAGAWLPALEAQRRLR
eukprot:3436944-Prymnesium_polylepis.1